LLRLRCGELRRGEKFERNVGIYAELLGWYVASGAEKNMKKRLKTGRFLTFLRCFCGL
jgi:hypothetical protein